MTVFRLADIAGRSPDEHTEFFDFQTSNAVHDIVLARLEGEHDGGVNRRSTFTYAVKSGSLTVSIDGTNTKANAGDVVTVEPGLHKVLNGTAELFIICSPPFDPADEV